MSRDYVAHTKHLLPPGKAYPRIDVGWLHKLVTGFVAGFERVDALAVDLRDEYFPPTATQLLADFERVFGLPDDCAPADTLEERRAAVQARLLAQGGGADGVGVDFLTALATSFGYSAFEIERWRRAPYTCVSPCTDPRDLERALMAWDVRALHATDATDARLRCEFDRIAVNELEYSFPLHRFEDGSFTSLAGRTATHPITGAVTALAVNEPAYVTLETLPRRLGYRWHRRTAALGYSGAFYGVASAAGRIVLVGSAGEIQLSLDGGRTWQRQTAAAGYTGAWSDVCWTGSMFVAVGAGGQIQTSADGETWVVRTSGYTSTFANVARVGAVVIATGKSAGIRVSADGGATWVASPAAGSFSGYLRCAAGTESVAVIAGDRGEIEVSVDRGATWSAREAAGGYGGIFTAAIAVGDTIVLGGQGGELQLSRDAGETWERRRTAAGFTGYFRDFAVAGYELTAYGSNGEIQASRDLGDTWVRRRAANGYTGAFRAAVAHGQSLVAVGDGTEIQTSEAEAA